MRKALLSALFLLVLISLVALAKDIPHNPVSISNGLTFSVPYSKYKRFYMTGLNNKKYTITDFMSNSVKSNLIDSTHVIFDNDLIANSGIEYISPIIPDKFDTATICVNGNLDPKVVRGFLKRF